MKKRMKEDRNYKKISKKYDDEDDRMEMSGKPAAKKRQKKNKI